MHTLSKRATQILQSSGWYLGREIDIEPFVESLQSKGYKVFPVVQNLLREFGGLRINYFVDEDRGIRDTLIIDPRLATILASSTQVKKWVDVIGKELCYVGIAFTHDVLMVSEDGNVYSAFDPYLDHIGSNYLEAIEIILKGRDISFTRLLPPPGQS